MTSKEKQLRDRCVDWVTWLSGKTLSGGAREEVADCLRQFVEQEIARAQAPQAVKFTEARSIICAWCKLGYPIDMDKVKIAHNVVHHIISPVVRFYCHARQLFVADIERQLAALPERKSNQSNLKEPQ